MKSRIFHLLAWLTPIILGAVLFGFGQDPTPKMEPLGAATDPQKNYFTRQFRPYLNLKDAHGAGISFRRSILMSGDFRNAQYPRSNFSYSDLTGADFRGANLRSANFIGANLTGANFDGADLRNARFQGSLQWSTSFAGVICNQETRGIPCP